MELLRGSYSEGGSPVPISLYNIGKEYGAAVAFPRAVALARDVLHPEEAMRAHHWLTISLED